MYTARQLRQINFPPENNLVGGNLLRANSLLVIGGPPKVMKSMIQLRMAMDCCSGQPLFRAQRSDGNGCHTMSFPVSRPLRGLIIEMEVGDYDEQVRLNTMWRNYSEPARELIDSNLMIESCNRDLRLDTVDGTRLISQLLEKSRPDVLFLDPLIEFHNVNESSSQDMGKVFRNIDLIRAQYKCAVVINHHRTKLSRDTTQLEDDSPESLRGSGLIYGKVDAAIMLRPYREFSEGTTINCSFTLRRGRPIPPLRLKVPFDTLNVEFDRWLDTTGSQPVVTHNPSASVN